MSETTEALLKTAGNQPVPQYYNPDSTNETTKYEALKGKDGAARMRVEDGHNVALGAKADAASPATNTTSPWSVISLLSGIWAKVEAVRAAIVAGLSISGTVIANQGTANATPWNVALANRTVTQQTLQNAATATGTGTAFDVSGMDTAALTVTGTFVGTITWEITTDDTNWFVKMATQAGTGAISPTAAVPGIYTMDVTGIKSVRANYVHTSGTVTVKGRATPGEAPSKSVTITGRSLTQSPVTGLRTISNSVATTVFAGAAKLAGRIYVVVYNTSNVIIYVGGAGVTTSTGAPINPGDSRVFTIDPIANPDIYAIAAGTSSVQVPVEEGK